MKGNKIQTSTLAAALLTVLSMPHAAYAQSQPSEQQPSEPQSSEPQPAASTAPAATELEKVAVTGSRIKRAQVEGPAPVTIISADQIKREGFSNVYEALSTLTEVTGTVQADVNKGPTPNASPLNLRNLGPGRTLLLIDGRRVADYPLPYEGRGNFANFNNIPMAMVERIEVLASGGSAIYGSDAMAGVINVILKKNYNGDEVRLKGGTTTRGGGDSFDLSWVGGRTGEKWSATYGLQWSGRETLFAGDREFVDSDYEPSSRVKPLVNDAWPWIWGVELIDVNNKQRITPPTGACDRFEDLPLHNFVGNEGNAPEFPGYSCTQGKGNALWSLRNGSDNKSAFGNFQYNFDNGMEAWVSASLWDSEGESRQDEALRFTLLEGRGGSWYDPQLGQRMQGRRAFTVREAGGSRTPFLFYTNERSWDVAGGLRGHFGDKFDWDATIGRTEYKVDFSFPAIVQGAIDNYFLGAQQGVTADGTPIYTLNQERFWSPMSADAFRSMTTHGHSSAESWMNQAQFAVNGELFNLPAGPVGFAGVLEAGSQGYRLRPDPLTYGPNKQYDQPGGVNQGGGDRKRYAAGVEFKFPLLASLNLTTAGRYDHYKDDSRKEGNFTWNTGLEWRPVERLLLRAAYNTTFRAPDMHYLFATSGTGTQEDADIANCVRRDMQPSCGTQDLYYRHDIARTGNLNLESETGKSWSAGFVWDATDNLSLSADYWRMTIDNQVQDFSITDILELESECINGVPKNAGDPLRVTPGSAECSSITSRVTRSAPGTNASGLPDSNYPLGQVRSVFSGPINLSYREVAGVDVSARYRLPATAWGDFSFAFNYTNQLKTNTRRDKGSPLIEGRDDEIRTFARASVSWERGPWTATLFANRLGHTNGDRYGECAPTLPGQDASVCRHVSKLKAPIYFNLTAGYQLTEQARVNLYVDNLFDEAEYKDPYKMFFIYANERVFSRVGREISAEFVYKFD
ncbi:TonB-dependent receptor plug domain-containing protein [Luteimonas panaciterrae]|uniref:TonB-dependent receptor plug domain-containing protein n=1 Tax=Luteimonas panaciterrae TaxID=363885 RepID=UPI001CF9A605|nr:TonB-dependent receptor [Luteimonas panaciterrae]